MLYALISIKQRILNFENLDANSSSDVLLDNLENIIFAAADVSLKKKYYEKIKEASNLKKVVRL